MRFRFWFFVATQAAIACVPDDPPKGSKPSGSPSKPQIPEAVTAPPGTPGVPPTNQPSPTADPPLTTPFSDGFDRPTLSAAWAPTTPAWRIVNGQLCVDHAKNHPVWLRRKLPTNARIEFDATSYSADGDIKAEFWGDGRSAADTVSYNDATSYLTIFGGWKNSFHVLARIDEHAAGRPEIRLDDSNDDPRARRVLPNRAYHFKIVRDDGRTIHWSIDDIELFTYTDASPLAGPGHDHFGFNDWEVRVCFDNLAVFPLP